MHQRQISLFRNRREKTSADKLGNSNCGNGHAVISGRGVGSIENCKFGENKGLTNQILLLPSPPQKTSFYKTKFILTSFMTKLHGNEGQPSFTWIMICAALYVLSGVTQPILMAWAKQAGLGNPKCQLYMLFYYLGPAMVGLTLRLPQSKNIIGDIDHISIRNEGASRKTYASASMDNNKSDEKINITHANNLSGDCAHDKLNENFTGGTTPDYIVSINPCDDNKHANDDEGVWPHSSLLLRASSIAMFDIFAQSLCYTGNNLAGPTIFAIIYSSVTIWAAIYSQCLLSRSLNISQWLGVFLVVLGLSLTAFDSRNAGEHVFLGACLIVVGSSLHGMTYVLSEMIMTRPLSSPLSNPSSEETSLLSSKPLELDPLSSPTKPSQRQHNLSPFQNQRKQIKQKSQGISVRANCAIQGTVACLAFLLWQIFYTLPRIQSLILKPMSDAGTSPRHAISILLYISFANLLHAITFFQTLKYFPGGATSAGVLKGLQAVLVFVTSSIILCGKWGGMEMCWNRSKLVSLVVVVSGILLYGVSTEVTRKDGDDAGSKKKDEKCIDV